jgi:hypothetical protein
VLFWFGGARIGRFVVGFGTAQSLFLSLWAGEVVPGYVLTPAGTIDDPSKLGTTGDDEDVRFHEWFDYSLAGVEVGPWNDEDEELRLAGAKYVHDAPFSSMASP